MSRQRRAADRAVPTTPQVLSDTSEYRAFIADLRFNDAWNQGRVGGISAFLRIRQIRRAGLVAVSPETRPH